MERASFTDVVRQELSRVPPRDDVSLRAELAGIVGLAGSVTMTGDEPGAIHLDVATTSGAVARRTFALLHRRYDVRPELRVQAPGGVRRRTVYHVRLAGAGRRVGMDLGVLDAHGRPTDEVPSGLRQEGAVAYVRGAVLAAGSISHPGRAPHLEIGVGSERAAEGLAQLVRGIVGGTVSVVAGPRHRVTLKSGERIGELLAALGATTAFLAWDDRRLRRQLRGEANRLTNADGANLRRSLEANARQVHAVEDAIRAVGWDGLDEDLRDVALARLANPEASLAELAELLDPPVGKSAVHRRLQRLARLAPEGPADAGPRATVVDRGPIPH